MLKIKKCVKVLLVVSLFFVVSCDEEFAGGGTDDNETQGSMTIVTNPGVTDDSNVAYSPKPDIGATQGDVND